MNKKQRRVLVLFVDNSSGVLNRITLLFSQKGFNIETITCSVTCVPSISRMTIVTEGDDTQISHIMKQTSKLIEVHSVHLIDHSNSIIRDLLLVKIEINDKNKREACNITNAHNGLILDIGSKSMIVELNASVSVIDGYLESLKNFNILELSRTGVTSIQLGDEVPDMNIINNFEF
ncbi:acetolactate synthase small subunit [Brachyspira hyodysenteriae]|uniref:Acetolactate synthase small subunit n=2 Tax=Brachyspira hyodysenteriae TaxID=159 RepID=A0A3B6V9G1_BRAHW|nr:acetolactate synthase small subunit [Brachyspira hyodysenteriae]ACN83529.1 acetolactate synthase small subunit [Brachyspira hyodysenteriae WA1]ANN64337.1 acetolactate synthase small subunit [Brachyspira hyodysenteriae ATCC 27164]KLI14226.1 acetolactate synthase [Brachyspira hyodysenteriae]KLI17032.1 acetolactate synthase [Brachyspira hyodysenteriae]KLI18380.1 acetolactate synthase [Brachyspira hyodysenteriae]